MLPSASTTPKHYRRQNREGRQPNLLLFAVGRLLFCRDEPCAVAGRGTRQSHGKSARPPGCSRAGSEAGAGQLGRVGWTRDDLRRAWEFHLPGSRSGKLHSYLRGDRLRDREQEYRHRSWAAERRRPSISQARRAGRAGERRCNRPRRADPGPRTEDSCA